MSKYDVDNAIEGLYANQKAISEYAQNTAAKQLEMIKTTIDIVNKMNEIMITHTQALRELNDDRKRWW